MIYTVNEAVFAFFLNVLLGKFSDEFLPLAFLSSARSSLGPNTLIFWSVPSGTSRGV